MFSWLRQRRQNQTATVPQKRYFRNAEVMNVAGDDYLSEDNTFYVLPKSDDEDARLDAQHIAIRWFSQGHLTYAPVNLQPYHTHTGETLRRQVLDVGCGSGLWDRDMALKYPNVDITGIDITIPAFLDRYQRYMALSEARRAEMRKHHFVHAAPPANFRYVEANIFSQEQMSHRRYAKLPFDDGVFDFVYQRLLTGAIPTELFPQEVTELRRVLRPGGWIELVESIGAIGTGPALAQMTQWGKLVSTQHGININAIDQIGYYLQRLTPQFFRQGTFVIPIGKQRDRNRDRKHIVEMMTLDYMRVMQKMSKAVVKLGIATQESWDAAYTAALLELEFPSDTGVKFFWAVAQFV